MTTLAESRAAALQAAFVEAARRNEWEWIADTFYAEDCLYKDPQTAAGLTGRAALAGYLEGLFAATPPMTYTPDETWPIPGGFCGRWYCEVSGGVARLRGFDLVILRGREIVLNEVYTHALAA